jgi:hypothetical protein
MRARAAINGAAPIARETRKTRSHLPDAIWFAFFSCSESLGLSSVLLVALPLAEASRPAWDGLAGDDIAPALALVSAKWLWRYTFAVGIAAMPLYIVNVV